MMYHLLEGQNRTLTQVIAEREQKMRDSSKLEKQKVGCVCLLGSFTILTWEWVDSCRP